MDIMRSVAYCFVKKKPVGSYILVGLRRNGKSSFVGLLHTIFGRENTSDVRLSQLGDPHYVNKLKYTMMNAPDEEDEIIEPNEWYFDDDAYEIVYYEFPDFD